MALALGRSISEVNMVKHFIIFVFILLLSIPSYSQTPNNSAAANALDDAQNSSQSLSFPSRSHIDEGLIVLGISSYFIARIKPKTEKVLEAQRAVQEIQARFHRQAPEMAAAREKYEQVHELRTLEETATQRKAWEEMVNTINRTAGVQDSKPAVLRIFTDDEIGALREAGYKWRTGMDRDKATLIPLAEKMDKIKEAQREIAEAQKIQDLQTKTIGLELRKAEYSLKIEEGDAIRKYIRVHPRVLKIGGIILVGLAAWDLYRTTENNTVGARIATPDELGQMAVALVQQDH
jgi:hypothetical protein